MGVNILETSSKFLSQYKNGVGFTDVLSDFNVNLAASVMEILQVKKEFDVSWNSTSKSTSSTWTVDSAAGTIFSTAGDFMQDSFSVGDEFEYEELSSGAGVNFTGKIQSINPTTIVFTLLTGSRTNADTIAIIRGLEPLTAINYGFGIIGLSETFNVKSKVSGSDQGYYGSNIGFDTGGGVRDTNFNTLLRLGTPVDWVTGGIEARFVENPNGNKTIQRFEVVHTFMVVPYFKDGELSNLQNLVPPSLFAGNNNLKYSYTPGLLTALSVPLSEKKVVYDLNLGSVAWFDENFGGFQNDYKIDSITYEELALGTPATGILIGSATRIRVTLQRVSGAFVGAERFGAYISYLPDEVEYINQNISELKENFIYDNALNNAGLAGVAGQDFITNCESSINGGGDMEIIIDVSYDNLQKAFLSQKFSSQPTYFMIGIQAGDISIVSPSSDKIMLLADVELYDQGTDIADLMHVTKFDVYTHEKQIGVTPGTTDAVTWNEDGLVIDFEFDVNLNLDALMNSLNFVLVAYNTVTGRFWEIDSYAFSPAVAIVSNGVQQVIENTTRGYILESSDQFNEVIISVGSQAAGLQKYEGRFAQKISWQEWLENLNVDTTFFDAAEPKNNFNDKASNYSGLENYSIRLGIFSNVEGTSPLGVTGTTDYLFMTPDIKVFNYDTDENVTPIWSCVIETFDSLGLINLGGAILTGQDTLFRATWTNSGGLVTSLANIYGINRLEETNQPGYEITEMSSLNLPDSGQILIPSTGSLLDAQVVSGNVVFECLIDGNITLPGVSYNLSSRIHNPTPPDPVIDPCDVTEGCSLPIDTFLIIDLGGGNYSIIYNSSNPIDGFQIDVDPGSTTISNVVGVDTVPNIIVTGGTAVILGFSFSGSMPPGCGVLLTFDSSSTITGVNNYQFVFEGNDVPMVIIPCFP